MLDLGDLRFFEAVATGRSLAATARALDVSPPAVSQRLRQIEQKLGVRLIERAQGRVILTDEGNLLVARARATPHDMDALYDQIGQARGQVQGTLRIAAPLGFGRRYVAPILAGLRTRHPELTVELALDDRPLRLDEAYDVTVHIGQMPLSGGVVVRLAPNDRILCAAPAYLSRRGAPQAAADLADHDCLVIRENDEDATLWSFTVRGKTLTRRIQPAMSSNDGEAAVEWARQGLGVIVRSEWSVAEDLAAGRLVRLLPDHALAPAPVLAFVRPRNSRLARTEAFLTALRESLSPPPWRSGGAGR